MKVVRALLVVLLGIPAACLAADVAPGPPDGSIRNGGFESAGPGNDFPSGWGSQGSSFGSARVVERPGASGGRALELAPAAGGSSGTSSFMVYQVLDVAKLRGQDLRYGARVTSEGAGVNLVLWTPQGSSNDFDPNVQQPTFVARTGTFTVPSDATILTFGIQVMGPGGSKAWVDDAFVRSANEKPIAESAPVPMAPPGGGGAGAASASVRIHADRVVRELAPDFFGMHIEWVDDANGITKPGTGEARPEVVSLLDELGVPLLRFPGGIHADYYDWKKGVGPSRGEIKSPFTRKSEPVRFGSPEFIALTKQLDARACITANYGTATAADAGAWAKWLTENGLTPRCWEVGNEIYLSGPSSTTPNGKDIFKPGPQYAKDYPAFASAIKAAIPDAKVGAIAHLDTGAFPLADASNPDWTVKMLSALTAKADFLALHNGYAPVVLDDSVDLGKEEDRRRMYRAMFAAPLQTRENLARMAAEITARSPVNANTPFAITEFGTLVGLSTKPDRHAAYVDHTRTQASALYVASLLDVYIGDPRVEMTMYTNPIHRWYGNLILDDPSGLVTSPTYHLYRLYRDRFEPRVVATDVQSPSFSTTAVGIVKAESDVPTLVGRASKSRDGKRLTALLVNRSLDGPLDTKIVLDGFQPARISCQILTAKALHAINGPAVSKTTLARSDVKPQPFACENAATQTLSLPAGSILSLVAEAS